MIIAQAAWLHCVASFLFGVLGGFEEDVLRSVAFVLRMLISLLLLSSVEWLSSANENAQLFGMNAMLKRSQSRGIGRFT